MLNKNKPLFLVVDDDDRFRNSLVESSILNDYANVLGVNSCELALEYIKKNSQKIDLILLDYDFRKYGEGNQMDGLELLRLIKEDYPNIPVIMMSGITDHRGKIAIQSIQNFAHGFLDKVENFDIMKVIDIYEDYKSTHQSHNEKILKIRNELEQLGFVTNNHIFLEQIYLAIESFRKNQKRIILIVGKTGSGKTYLARQIHKVALKTNTEPVIAHCSHFGKDANTIRDYLFGHKAGAFTGADKEKAGIFDTRFTIILDDIQHISNDAQKILLEVLQDWIYSPFGDEKIKQEVKSRIIVTSIMSPDDLLKIGFLEEFVNRISGEILTIPPLHKRVEDIPNLIKQFASKYPEKDFRFDPNLIDYIIHNFNYQNIRKLHQFVDNLIVHSENNYISFDVLRKILNTKKETQDTKYLDFDNTKDSEFNLENEIIKLRRDTIIKALKKYKGNVQKASIALGYKNHNGLMHWIKKLEINVNSFK